MSSKFNPKARQSSPEKDGLATGRNRDRQSSLNMDQGVNKIRERMSSLQLESPKIRERKSTLRLAGETVLDVNEPNSSHLRNRYGS